MGNLFSGKKKTAKEELELIQQEIDSIETYKLSSFVLQKNFIALLYLLYFLIYTFGLIYIYFKFNKNDKLNLLLSLMFIILLPISLYYLKKLIHYYFKWCHENKSIRLIQLIKLKKTIISKVQETETFNDAKTILEKYDPTALRNLSLSLTNLTMIDSPVRKYTNNSQPPSSTNQQFKSPPQQQSFQRQNQPQSAPFIRNSNFVPRLLPPPQQQQSSSATTTSTNFIPNRTIKPILPQNRSVVEKLIDYVFNDGPSNRYALICRQCSSHNGMALPQEFDYLSFICAYCGTYNPSRKNRPIAPEMQQPPPQQQQQKAIEAAPSSPSSKPRSYSTSATMNNSSSSSINSPLNIIELSTEGPHIEEPPEDDPPRPSTPKNPPPPTTDEEDNKKVDDEPIRSIDSDCSTASSTTTANETTDATTTTTNTRQ